MSTIPKPDESLLMPHAFRDRSAEIEPCVISIIASLDVDAISNSKISDYVTAHVMKHFRGTVNPVAVRNLVGKHLGR